MIEERPNKKNIELLNLTRKVIILRLWRGNLIYLYFGCTDNFSPTVIFDFTCLKSRLKSIFCWRLKGKELARVLPSRNGLDPVSWVLPSRNGLDPVTIILSLNGLDPSRIIKNTFMYYRWKYYWCPQNEKQLLCYTIILFPDITKGILDFTL